MASGVLKGMPRSATHPLAAWQCHDDGSC